ncbi:hypothetical protein GCM10025777_24360 [Membranihabitans marinus]
METINCFYILFFNPLLIWESHNYIIRNKYLHSQKELIGLVIRITFYNDGKDFETTEQDA